MKKILVLFSVVFFLVACQKEVDLVGFWHSNDGSIYQFNEDGTCKKATSAGVYDCTYTKENGVVDIVLSNGTMESGQINPDFIIIGSDMYKKGE